MRKFYNLIGLEQKKRVRGSNWSKLVTFQFWLGRLERAKEPVLPSSAIFPARITQAFP